MGNAVPTVGCRGRGAKIVKGDNRSPAQRVVLADESDGERDDRNCRSCGIVETNDCEAGGQANDDEPDDQADAVADPVFDEEGGVELEDARRLSFARTLERDRKRTNSLMTPEALSELLDNPMDPSSFDEDSVRCSMIGLQELNVIRVLMPPVFQRPMKGSAWRMLFNMSTHGASLEAMYQGLNESKNPPPYLIAVRDTKGATFGCFVASEIVCRPNKYYGTGECFLFSIKPEGIHHYPWTGRNSYFIASSGDCIALGGGGSFGLHLDGDLNRGSSARSETFDNPCLAGSEDSQCFNVQVWGIGRSGPEEEDR